MIKDNKKMKPTQGKSTPERIYAFSDGVFAIIITIMVLALKTPGSATFYALLQLWPTWLSYVVSYMFIAIVWINHHYLLRYAAMWANFAHLFSVSFIPFFTEWIAETKLQAVPVAMYAFVFLLVNVTYLWLAWELLCEEIDRTIRYSVRHLLHMRSFITISLFAIAIIIAFWFPFVGFGIICCCLLLYVRPELPEIKIKSLT
jgi:uncharacterized membrane protein